jgi:hypothetical protein
MEKLNSQEISGVYLLNPDNLRLELVPCLEDRHGLIGSVVSNGGAAGIEEIDAVHLAPEGFVGMAVTSGSATFRNYYWPTPLIFKTLRLFRHLIRIKLPFLAGPIARVEPKL